MFSFTDISHTTQQFICISLATLIVAGSLTLAAYGAQALADPGYTVTTTQL
jgi:hypothetical protein